MSFDQLIAPVGAIRAPDQTLATTATGQLATGSTPAAGEPNAFGDLVTHGISEVNRQLMSSQTELQDLASGHVQNLHQVMVNLEESRISFQLMLQVRNRLLESYQDLMRMQV
jgi:flagellar hook-basal body complex protein FliE